MARSSSNQSQRFKQNRLQTIWTCQTQVRCMRTIIGRIITALFPAKAFLFQGRDGDDCDDFVFYITQRAANEGKTRDDAWTADLALRCMARGALRWYAQLEPDVQDSWRLLRRALLEKYPASGEEGSPSTRATMCVELAGFTSRLTPFHLDWGRSYQHQPPLRPLLVPLPLAVPLLWVESKSWV